MTNLIRLQDEARAARLQEFLASPNPLSLTTEIATLRLLMEESVNGWDKKLAISCAKAIGQLVKQVESAQLRRGELLAKPVVLALAKRFAELIAANIEGKFEGWEDVMDTIQVTSREIITDSTNDPETMFPA